MAIPRVSALARRVVDPAMADEPNGFLGRWARRKTEVLQGRQPDALAAVEKAVKPDRSPVPVLVAADAAPAAPALRAVEPSVAAPAQAEPVLSLDDTRLLTPASDFKPFMARGVGRDVRNAAMKKLFADPHFNVMDGLDIYIDDYSKPDPVSEAMLRQMNGAKFLNLFDDEAEPVNVDAAPAPALGAGANTPTDQTVAQSDESPEADNPALAPPTSFPDSSQPESAHPLPDPGASQKDHADIDLRLQPDHATPASNAGRGAS